MIWMRMTSRLIWQVRERHDSHFFTSPCSGAERGAARVSHASHWCVG